MLMAGVMIQELGATHVLADEDSVHVRAYCLHGSPCIHSVPTCARMPDSDYKQHMGLQMSFCSTGIALADKLLFIGQHASEERIMQPNV